MRKLSSYLTGLLCGLAPTMVQAHAQFTPHHHSEGTYWLSELPELLVVGALLAGLALLLSYLKR